MAASIEPVGRVTAFFPKPSAAVIQLTATLRVGEIVHIKGRTTDLVQPVGSLQIAKRPVQQAEAGQVVGLVVAGKCRRRDVVYRLNDD